MTQAMFNSNTQGPDDECFMAVMQGLMLQHAPSSSFGSLTVILGRYVGGRIDDVTTVVVSLGEAKTH